MMMMTRTMMMTEEVKKKEFNLFVEILYNRFLATTNTEDSHTSVSSAAKIRRKKTSYSTNRWLTTIGVGGSGLRRYRKRV
jgi:hypothetical protein